jgi:hypothetical protein
MGQLEVRVLAADTEDLRGGSMLEWDVHGETATAAPWTVAASKVLVLPDVTLAT